jgi:hypothetical protein
VNGNDLGEVLDPTRPGWTDQLAAELQRQLGGRVRGLCLLAHADGLILRGQARTYYAKQLAQHAVMRATGFRILANEIEVS